MGHVKAKIERLKFETNFYRVHLFYFLLTIILSSIIMYGSGINGNSDDAQIQFKLRYIDAIFLCASAMTNAGLNTVNLNDITGFQQAILCVLILIGNLTVTTNAAIWVRRYFFRKHLKNFLEHSKAAREIVHEIDGEEKGKIASLANGAVQTVSSGIRRLPRATGLQNVQSKIAGKRRKHHETGHGGFPYPWETETSRKLVSKFTAGLTFQPSFDRKGRFHSLSEREAEELGGVEYRALGVLMWLLPAYVIFWLGLAMVVMIPWSYRAGISDIIRYQQPGDLSPGWWASFLVVSGYGNCGLDLLGQNMIPFRGFYLALIVIGGASLAGNTFFPSFLRLAIWTTAKIVPVHSRLHQSLSFLLHHPRRCFTLLFPSINTWYLTAIQAGLHLLLWIFWIILQIDYPTITDIPPGNRVMSGLFQALGVRTAGLYIISMSDIAPALLVLYTAAMYISGLPIIIWIRSTNIYEEVSLGVQKNKKSDDEFASEHSYIGTHLSRQLTSDAWWVFICFFLICIVERDALSIPSPGFNVYNVLFETVSAFGLVGVTTGVPYDNYSFCGAWHTVSKLVLIVVMLRGRHRGLPMAIDRAVLLPGQELMERMDREYNRTGDWKPRVEVEEEMRREEGEREVEEEKEMEEKMDRDPDLAIEADAQAA